MSNEADSNHVKLTVALITIFAVGLGLLIVARSRNRVTFFKDVPILPGFPVIGTAVLLVPIFGFDSHYEVLKLIDKYGSICQCLLLGKHCLLINNPKVIKVAMEKVKGKGDFHQRIFPALNIFSADTNNDWKQRRHSFRHAFTTVNLRRFRDDLERISNQLSSLLEENTKSNAIVNIDELFGRFALDAIFNVGLQWDCNFLHNRLLYEKLNNGVQGMFEFSWVPHVPMFGRFAQLNLPFYPYKQYSEAASTIREFQIDILQHLRDKYRLGELATGSFGRILMEFGEQHQLTEEEYLSEILVFIVAGHETTAHTLSWIIYALCRDLQLQERCHTIMSQTLSLEEDTNATSFALLPDYIEAVIKEAMRKYPVASRGSFRVVNDEEGVDLPIGLANHEGQDKIYPETIHLKKGTWIGINFFSAHHAKENWGDDAFDFRPERWLRKEINDKDQSSDMNSPAVFAGFGNANDSISFLPFSYGPRNCVGMNMALWEIRTALKMLLTDYHFRFADPKFMDEAHVLQTDITLKPLLSLPVHITKRQ